MVAPSGPDSSETASRPTSADQMQSASGTGPAPGSDRGDSSVPANPISDVSDNASKPSGRRADPDDGSGES
jgi:hypothetical protein